MIWAKGAGENSWNSSTIKRQRRSRLQGTMPEARNRYCAQSSATTRLPSSSASISESLRPKLQTTSLPSSSHRVRWKVVWGAPTQKRTNGLSMNSQSRFLVERTSTRWSRAVSCSKSAQKSLLAGERVRSISSSR